MAKKYEIMEQLTGKWMVIELIEYLEETFEDFADVHDRYLRAIEHLRSELKEERFPSVDALVDAIERQTISNLLFSGVLGIKANLDHFINPMARTVLDVDFEVFLREDIAHRLPEYRKAQDVIDCFFENLSLVQKEMFDDIQEFISYLETIGPKVAHYCGYTFGDELLHRVVPGYCPDKNLTLRYRMMLENQLGKEALEVADR